MLRIDGARVLTVDEIATRISICTSFIGRVGDKAHFKLRRRRRTRASQKLLNGSSGGLSLEHRAELEPGWMTLL